MTGIIETVKDVEYMKTQFGNSALGSGINWFKIVKEDVALVCSMSAWTRGLGSSFILAHGSYGRLGAVGDGSQAYLGDSRPSFTFQESGDNMVFTNQGIDLLIGALAGRDVGSPTFMIAGSSATAPASGDTILGSVYNSSVEGLTSISSGADWVEFETIWSAVTPTEQSCYFREIGLLAGSPTGSLMQHSTFTGIEKTSDLELQTTIRFDIS